MATVDPRIYSFVGLLALIAILLFAWAPFSLTTKASDGFRNKTDDRVVLDTSKTADMFPYTTDPINSLDQYELEAVFNNSGDRELKQTEINKLTRQYPMDWSGLPPNSSRFQSENAKYIEGFLASDVPDQTKQFEAIGDGNLTPPDTLAMEKEEQRILSTYAPKKTEDLTTYDVDDAQTLIDKIYKPKNLIPKVVRKENNVFEVVSTRSLKDKVEYEDDLPDAPTSLKSVPEAGEATIHVPPTATETAAGHDPFYEPTTSTRADRSDYTKWTPGLERMFAPTYPQTDWIGSAAAAQGTA
jgi:hypothetical protein